MGKARTAASGSGGGLPPDRRARIAAARAGRAGFSLIEVLLAVGIVLFTAAVLSRSVVFGARLSESTRESALASEAARRVLEEMSAAPFDQVFALYNATDADDPGPGPAPGAGFAVPGLSALPGDPDGLPGEIILPAVDAGGGQELREDVVDEWLGMPRDLSGDGVIDDLDHAGDYRILPVHVRVVWASGRGTRTLEVGTVLTER